jgi:DNA helicase HerA-like ATPase
LHRTQNEVVQRGLALFILYRIYQEMFRRGLQDRITHAVFFDEAHRASKLKRLARLAKECRKYGLAMILASQKIKDFDDSLVQAIGTYLALRAGESDSKVVARYLVPADQVKSVADALKMLPKFQGYFFTEGYQSGRRVSLTSPDRE